MTVLDLLKSASATLNAGGAGTIVIGPEKAGESWSVTRMSIQCTSALQTNVRVYRNVISTLTMLFDSAAGNGDVASGDPPLDIPRNSAIVLQWTGGTPGSVATVVLEGKLTR